MFYHAQKRTMKKLLVLLMTAALLVSMFVMPVNAAGDMEVLKGTPLVDGKIDDIYLESFSCNLINSNIVAESWGSGATNTVEDALCYVLWDDNYMYFVFQVADSSIYSFTLEEAKIDPHHEGFPSAIDGIMMDFFMNDGNDIYVVADAYGNFVWASDDAADYMDVSKLKSAAVVDESGELYTIEIAVPFEDLPGAANVGWHYCVKNTGRKNDKGGFGSMGGLEGGIYGGHKFELLSTTVSGSGDTEPVTDAPVTDAPVTDAPVTDAPVTDAPVTDAPVTDAPVTDAPATDAPATDAPETTPNPENPDAPQTADAVVIFAVVALCAAIALVVISKKRTA